MFAATENGLVAVEGARVRAEIGSARVEAVTDQTGGYQMAGLYSGSHTVSTSKDGYLVDTRTVSVTGDTRLDIRIAKRVFFTLFGRVFETTPSGPVPIAGLEMYCDACGEVGHTGLSTDAGGNYSFAHVPNERVTVQMSRGSYMNVRRDVTVSGTTQFDITLDPLK